LIAAEDTRHTRKLLQHFAIATPTTAYHEHNKLGRIPALLDTLTRGDVALVSDAGTPGINDPGLELVQAAIAAGFAVVPIPGPSASIAALVASGLSTSAWLYLGFLPARSGERRRAIGIWRDIPATLILFEAPHRLVASLQDLQSVLGDRRIAIARELTKLHEAWVRGTIGEAIAHFTSIAPRGEFTLVVEGYHPSMARDEAPRDEESIQQAARSRLQALRAVGLSGSAAARQVARELDLPRGTVYKLWTSLTAEDEQ
jgi:16S rRNA (cytidine1402-2'-O)-methyltransferase